VRAVRQSGGCEAAVREMVLREEGGEEEGRIHA